MYRLRASRRVVGILRAVDTRIPITHAQTNGYPQSNGAMPLRFFANSKDNTPETKSFDPDMMQYLVCPITKGPLVYDNESNKIISTEVDVIYNVSHDGIPDFVPMHADITDERVSNPNEPSDAEIEEIMKRIPISDF
eukprot:GEZU01030875.1.p2 GENE.GEZU01030875.1~~GEZU01030875.1.p2  ORF type:complete len:137 (-),score=15.34 GEZU01030875.1:31-441(-)